MPDRNHAGYRAYLASVGRPVVTAWERAEAQQLRSQGLSLREIAVRLGRVKSTIHDMLKDGKNEPLSRSHQEDGNNR